MRHDTWPQKHKKPAAAMPGGRMGKILMLLRI